jgi:hypothetical protein
MTNKRNTGQGKEEINEEMKAEQITKVERRAKKSRNK